MNMLIVLISPNFSEIESREGNDLRDALEGFWSSVWEQGWNPDEKILDRYGKWTVYGKRNDGSLDPVGTLKDLYNPAER